MGVTDRPSKSLSIFVNRRGSVTEEIPRREGNRDRINLLRLIWSKRPIESVSKYVGLSGRIVCLLSVDDSLKRLFCRVERYREILRIS